jgi:benzil reductase ((S)-benzoin forming)
MSSDFYMITGTSRGIGAALASRLLAEGHVVLGVSRSAAESLQSERYHHLKCDLADASAATQIVTKAESLVAEASCEFLCLVNNAARLEPLKAIEECSSFEIEAHIQIGLIAPMALTSKFIHTFAQLACRKKVAFISSGAAIQAMPGASSYCSSKAGLTMFSRCVGMEQKGREKGFETVSINPGMVETDMQVTARSKSDEEFQMAPYFKEAQQSGKVQELGPVVEKIARILTEHQDPGAFVSCTEMQS